MQILDTKLILMPNLSARSWTNNPALSCISTSKNSSNNYDFLEGPGFLPFMSIWSGYNYTGWNSTWWSDGSKGGGSRKRRLWMIRDKCRWKKQCRLMVWNNGSGRNGWRRSTTSHEGCYRLGRLLQVGKPLHNGWKPHLMKWWKDWPDFRQTRWQVRWKNLCDSW